MPTTAREGNRPTATVLNGRWQVLASQLREAEVAIRLDRPDAVHDFRVAARRLSSNLVGLAPLLRSEECADVERQLKTASREVSGVRDATVVEGRVQQLLRDHAADADVVRTGDLLHRLLAASYQQSRERATDYLGSDVYDDFTRRLERFADLPPWLPEAQGPADETLKPLLRRLWGELRAKTRRSLATELGTVRDERLHDVRKAAKEVRYLAESLAPVLGRKAERMEQVALRAQKVLGRYQDGVMTQALLAHAEELTVHDGQDAGLLGRMQAQEATAMAGRYVDFERVAEGIERKSRRRWLR